MMRYGSIYVATNKNTGEQYVGQTRQSVQKRWAAHWRTAICNKSKKAKFQDALVAAGQNAFSVEEVFVAFDAEKLNQAEIELISALEPTYNSSRGGKGLRPVVVSEEIKRKRSEAAKMRWANPEWKAKTVVSIQRAGKALEAKERGKKIARIGSAARAKHVFCPELQCTFLSIADTAKYLNMSHTGVRYAIHNKIKTQNKYTLVGVTH
jgi:group I intron endonuclease